MIFYIVVIKWKIFFRYFFLQKKLNKKIYIQLLYITGLAWFFVEMKCLNHPNVFIKKRSGVKFAFERDKIKAKSAVGEQSEDSLDIRGGAAAAAHSFSDRLTDDFDINMCWTLT